MKDYTENAPVFSPKIRIAETTDPGHADIINAAPKQLLQNTLCNQKEIGQLKKGVGIGSTGEYGTGTKYHAGEYCMYGGEMYRCLKDTEGAWNQECWVQTSPVGEIMSLRRSLESFAGLFGKDEGGNLRKLGEAAYAGISKNFDTTEEGFVPDSQLLKALKDQVDQQNSALESCSGELHEYNKATWDAFKEKWDTLPNGWFNILVNYTCFFGWKESINAGGVIGIGRQQRRPGYMFRNGTFWTPTTFL